jgi:uncharacterized protein YdiU (UPF0061 family)
LDEVRFEEDIILFTELEKMLVSVQPDMTIFYQLLIYFSPGSEMNTREEVINHFKESFYDELSTGQADNLYNWTQMYVKRRSQNTISSAEGIERMKATSPRFILRNYLLHKAIEDLEKGDDTLFLKLQNAIKEPYSGKFDEFFEKRPSWASQKAGCSMLSCSS